MTKSLKELQADVLRLEHEIMKIHISIDVLNADISNQKECRDARNNATARKASANGRGQRKTACKNKQINA